MNLFQYTAYPVFLLFPLLSSAAELSLETGVNTYARYNDNLTLRTTNEKDVVGGSFKPNLTFKIDGETQSFKAVADVNLTRYNNEPDLRRNEGSLGLSWNKRYQRAQLSVSSGYKEQSNLDQTLDLAGLTDQEVTRNTAYLKPSWSYMLSENNLLSLQYSFTDTTYDEPDLDEFGSAFENVKAVNFADFQQQSYTALFRNTLTENDDITFSVSMTDYDGEGNGLLYIGNGPFDAFFTANEQFTEYKNVAYDIGYSHKFSEIQKMEFSVGANKTDTDTLTIQHNIVFNPFSDNIIGETPADTSKRGSKYKFLYEYSVERESLTVDISQDIISESTGVLVDQQQVVFDYLLKTSERLNYGVKLTALTNETVVANAGVSLADRERLNFTPSVHWKFAKDWSLSVKYNFAYLDQKTTASNAKSNEISFSVNWRWPKMLSSY